MAGLTAALKFSVRRRSAVLVAPAAPTPRELKLLSDIDDQESVRIHVPAILLYLRNEAMVGRDPVQVIRDAIARALVHYYPFAGRLREVDGGKLAVDCTGEGVLFIEADADDLRLEHLGEPLLPPFPCLQELLFDVPGSSAIVDAPLMLFQVTRLACGGFVLAVRINHTMADGLGMVQFGAALAELARGAPAPTVRPVWERELLMARDPPPRPSFAHREYDEAQGTDDDTLLMSSSLDDLAHRCLFFTPRDVDALRDLLDPPQLRASATTFDVLAGCLWKCRTVALAPDANAEMRMMSAVNLRGIRTASGGIPRGYYGNAAVGPVAVSTAGALCANPLGYAVELVKKAKEEADMEYIRSVADLVVQRGRPPVSFVRTYVVSDVRKAPAARLDFGWGRPVYGGPADVGGELALVASYFVSVTDARGEEGIVVPVCLPRPAMERFAEEMGRLLQRPLVDVAVRHRPSRSAL